MRTFPRRMNGGKDEIPFGYSMVCADQTSFARLLAAI